MLTRLMVTFPTGMFNLWLPWETVRPQVLNLSCALTFFLLIFVLVFNTCVLLYLFISSYNNFLLSVLWRTCIQSRSFHVGCWCCDWHVLQYVHSLFLIINFFLLIFFRFPFPCIILAPSLHLLCIFFDLQHCFSFAIEVFYKGGFNMYDKGLWILSTNGELWNIIQEKRYAKLKKTTKIQYKSIHKMQHMRVVQYSNRMEHSLRINSVGNNTKHNNNSNINFFKDIPVEIYLT